MTKSSLWWGGLSGLPFGICVAVLITDSSLSQALVVVSLFIVGCIAGSISLTALSVAGGVAASGVFISGLDHLPGNLNIPMWSVALTSVILIISVSLLARESDQSKRMKCRTYVLEFVALITSFLLVNRWPIQLPIDHLAFVSNEDNAAWISTAANFRSGHYTSGLGGFVLDPLMGTLHFLISFGSNGIAQNTGTSFVATGTTYAMVEFLAILMVGLTLIRLTPKIEKTNFLQFVATPGVIALAYSAIQIPQSTGHLTFIGALMFIWSLGVLGNDPIAPNGRHSYSAFILSSLLLVGITGMWWPLLLITPLSGIFSIFFVLPVHELRSRLTVGGKTIKQFVIAASMVAVVLVLVCIPILRGFFSLSIREFFLVKGGLHPASTNLLLAGTLTLCVLTALLETSQLHRTFPRSPSNIFTTNIVLIGVLAVLLNVASMFIGPEYTQNYSVQKMTLLFALACVPLLVITVVKGVERIARKTAEYAAVPFIFFLGSLTVGWNLNTPRVLTPPSWGATLISIANDNPNALILCSTSDPARNLEAYLCTRHAAALQPEYGDSATDWRHVQLFPTKSTPEDEARILRLKSVLSALVSQQRRIVLLTLEKDFAIAEEDGWWMNQLPLGKIPLVGVSG